MLHGTSPGASGGLLTSQPSEDSLPIPDPPQVNPFETRQCARDRLLVATPSAAGRGDAGVEEDVERNSKSRLCVGVPDSDPPKCRSGRGILAQPSRQRQSSAPCPVGCSRGSGQVLHTPGRHAALGRMTAVWLMYSSRCQGGCARVESPPCVARLSYW